MKLSKSAMVALAFLFTSVANAFESGTDYNSANMSYTANSTISQNIVFDNAMQSGGTLTFSVEAHAGGGRNLQHDTGQLKLEYYNGSTLLGSSTTSYATGNLLQMNAWSSGPGDNSEPWSTLSLTSTDCGTAGSCASVTHVKVIMIGTDTSWWAGNYGPQWRVPTVTFTPTGGSAGSNILYNPEFGLDPTGVFAQGWTSSSSWGACGTTSGSVMCTTTAAGVTANMSGGGYDANGGTTAATPGGYTGTLSVTSFSGSGGGSGSGSPTVTGTTTTNQTTTSNSRGSSTTATSTVDGTASETDVVTRGTSVTTVVETRNRGDQTAKTLTVNQVFTTTVTTPVTTTTTTVTPYTTTTTVTTPVTVTTVTTPVTVTTYSDGTSTTTNGTATTSTSTSDEVVTSVVVGTTTTVAAVTVDEVLSSATTTAYQTRIDQFDRLAEANIRENSMLVSDPLIRHRAHDGEIKLIGANVNERTVFDITASRSGTDTVDGYQSTANRYSLGIAHLVKTDLMIGGQFSQINLNMDGNNSTGSLYKNAVNLYALWTRNDWLVKGDVGHAKNKFNTTHALPDLNLSNSASAAGEDLWAQVRLYTPAKKGVRLFAGARKEQNRRDSATDSGSALSAVDYAAVNKITDTTEAGIRVDHYVNDKMSVYAEYSQNSRQLETGKAGLSFISKKNATIQIGTIQQRQNDLRNSGAMLELKILF
jgi:hypothetical protein